MRFETISNVDLLKYALKSMREKETNDADEEYLLSEQIAELEDTLTAMTSGTKLDRVKKLKIGAKFGDWYYQKFEDTENDFTVYSLYDSSGEYVNDFLGLGEMKNYIHKLYSAKAK